MKCRFWRTRVETSSQNVESNEIVVSILSSLSRIEENVTSLTQQAKVQPDWTRKSGTERNVDFRDSEIAICCNTSSPNNESGKISSHQYFESNV